MERYIPVITKHYSCRVDIDDIIYIQQQQKKLAIVTDDEIYSYYEKIENVLDYLDKRFFRVMKKLVVNLDKISMVKNSRFILRMGRTYIWAKIITSGRNKNIRLTSEDWKND